MDDDAPAWTSLSDSLGAHLDPTAAMCERCGVVMVAVAALPDDVCPVCLILDALNLWPAKPDG